MVVTDPYVGLRPYGRDDSPLFHGRDLESRQVATLWRAAGLTVLYGASGVGKTSLLHAGLLPRLPATLADVLPVAAVPSPASPPAGGGNPYVMSILSTWAGEPEHRMAGMTITQFLRHRSKRCDEYGDPLPVLVAIDRAEAMFHSEPVREKERKEFVDQLTRAMQDHPELHLLLLLREDYLYLVLPYERPFGQGSRTRFHLQALTPPAAKEAVQKPIGQSRRTITEPAVEYLVSRLRGATADDGLGNTSAIELDTVEPVRLQVLCSALWDALPDDVEEISEEHARVYSDIEGFLFDVCERAAADVATKFGLTVSEILLWLRHTFVTEHGALNVIYESPGQTHGMPNAVIRALADRHILRSEHRLGIQRYEPAHAMLLGPISPGQSPDAYLEAAEAARAESRWTLARLLADEAVHVADTEHFWVRAHAAEIHAAAAAASGDSAAVAHYCDEAAMLYAERGLFDGVARVLTIDGRSWMAQGDNAQAINRISKALDFSPNDLSAQMALAELFRRSGTPRAAAAVIDSIRDQLPAELLDEADEMLRR
jgi:hypothetical protein